MKRVDIMSSCRVWEKGRCSYGKKELISEPGTAEEKDCNWGGKGERSIIVVKNL